jgi:predicted phosphodiesterase
MQKLLQFFLKRLLIWVGNRLSDAPKKETVFQSLTDLYNSNKKNSNKIGTLSIDAINNKFIIFSDQHKGNRDKADDFANNEFNYISALSFYRQQNFSYINLGDGEELWKYKMETVLPNNEKAFAAESTFQPNNFFKVFGNHDLIWKNKTDTKRYLKKYFTQPLPIYEAIILKINIDNKKLDIFCTHGHQGDKLSDNNALSSWLVAHIWAPVQRYLQINVNAPSKDDTLRNKHNKIMYQWSSQQKNVLLITGHTHQPVFASGKYSTHPSNNIERDTHQNIWPTYFNTGCCCFNDGDITGIEIADGFIRLIKWHQQNDMAERTILEEISLSELINDLD